MLNSPLETLFNHCLETEVSCMSSAGPVLEEGPEVRNPQCPAVKSVQHLLGHGAGGEICACVHGDGDGCCFGNVGVWFRLSRCRSREERLWVDVGHLLVSECLG